MEAEKRALLKLTPSTAPNSKKGISEERRGSSPVSRFGSLGFPAISPLHRAETSLTGFKILNPNSSTGSEKIKKKWRKTLDISVLKVEKGVAHLMTEDFQVIKLPTFFLPDRIQKGNIIRLSTERNRQEEKKRWTKISDIQEKLLEKTEKNFEPTD